MSETISPNTIIELGVCAGAGADAYLSACPEAAYTGIDTFGEPWPADDDSPWKVLRKDDDSPWKPYDIAKRLLEDRGFKKFHLITANLRHLNTLPHTADLVVVDAAHDFENEYADLQLALTARPKFIFVDDAEDEAQAKPAIQKFLDTDLKGRCDYIVPIEYIGGGLVIKTEGMNASTTKVPSAESADYTNWTEQLEQHRVLLMSCSCLVISLYLI